MLFAQALKYYNLNPQQFKTILSAQGVKVDLRFIRTVKTEWLQYLSVSTGKPVPEAESGTSKEAPKSLKEVISCNDLASLENLVDGPEDEGFVALVKFVAEDESHAFIKKISNINQISNVNLHARDENDYILKKDISGLTKGQLIICKGLKNSKGFASNRTKVLSHYFKGLLSIESSFTFFTDWTSLGQPFTINQHIHCGEYIKDEGFHQVTLNYLRGKFSCSVVKNIDKEADDKLKWAIVNRFPSSIKNKLNNHTDRATVKAFKHFTDEQSYKGLLINQCKEEIKNTEVFENDNTLNAFIIKWNSLDSSILRHYYFKPITQFEVLYTKWLNGMLPHQFWEDKLVAYTLEYLKLQKGSSTSVYNLHSKLNDIQLKEVVTQLKSYIKDASLIVDNQDNYHLLKTLSGYIPTEEGEEYRYLLKGRLSEKVQFQLWLQKEAENCPKDYALNNFANLKVAEQERVIEILSDEELPTVIKHLKKGNSTKTTERCIKSITQLIIENTLPISFDIETDQSTIYELAFGHAQKWEDYRTQEEISNGLIIFQSIANDQRYLLLGHNIVSFDCPILEKQGIHFNKELLWDTLLMEMSLSPGLNNMALKTAHHALNDAQLTFQLFVNQLLRILKKQPDDIQPIYDCLNESVLTKLSLLREKLPVDWLTMEHLEEERNTFFRPQPRSSLIIEKLELQLKSLDDSKIVIIGPEVYAKELLHIKNMHFLDRVKTDPDFALVDIQDVKENEQLTPWEKSVLRQYYRHSLEAGHYPYWGKLAPAIRIKIAERTDIFSFLSVDDSALPQSDSYILFLTVDQFFSHQDAFKYIENLKVINLDPDLITVTQKTLLKEFDLDSWLTNSENDQLWMKFSGGQSIIGITSEQAANYLDESKLVYSNYWIEKYQFGKYRLYGNNNWEENLNKLTYVNQLNITNESTELDKNQAYFAIVSSGGFRQSQVVRFNPESIYRSRYWVFQKMLIQQIKSHPKPIILVVGRSDEVDALEQYFKSLGYFIPSRKMTLGRRLELLHQHRALNKIVIATSNNIARILHANYLGELNVVLDSFNLAENSFVAKESALLEKLSTHTINTSSTIDDWTGDEEDEESVQSNKSLPSEKDIFLQLKLQLPQINYVRQLLKAYDEEHTLWLLDSRIGDFPALGEAWNATRKFLSIWSDYESYEADAKEADKHIHSVKPVNELPFEVKEIKTILSNTFIGKGKNWYDYQEEYLDHIIPGEKDFLVSLPTGGGKSLLFQAPSLFKSAFSNRLTIVVTPLKALMEDQVKALWNKGFIGCVDYINSDRSTDVNLIYRNLAGGELTMLFITPERFRSKGFLNALQMRLQSDGGLEYAVFDEAHCVSQWGHEFRPDYLNSAKAVYSLKQKSETKFPILLFSATVSEKVYEDFNTIFA